MRDAFLPVGASVSLDVTATSQTKTLPAGSGYVRLSNTLGTNACFILFGNDAVVATAVTGFCLPPRVSEVFRIPEGCDTIAAICLSAVTTTLSITGGQA